MRHEEGKLYKLVSSKAVLLSMSFAVFVLFLLASISLKTTKNVRTQTPESKVLQASQRPIIVDHSSINLFEQIPDQYLEAARNLRVMFSDRSVGQNINEYLDCFSATSWATSPSACRRAYYNSSWNFRTFLERDRVAGVVPASILFSPDPVKYNRSNWTFVFRGGSYSDLTRDFITSLAPQYLNTKDVLTYQFSYLNIGEEGSNINSTVNGFWGNSAGTYDVNDLETFIAAHPDKIFPFWTTSLARGIGTAVGMNFNNMMRQYALSHNKVLFDVADILSYTADGEPCYDNRDGVAYTSQQGQTENHPNDGFDYPAICQDFTTETDGGHLGSVSAGGLRVAKGFWIMMAQIAGWNPYGDSQPTPTYGSTTGNDGGFPTSTSTPTYIYIPTFTPTPYPTATSMLSTPTPTALYNTNVHVGDIDGLVKVVNGGWQARVEVWPHTQSHSPIVGAVVRGRFTSVPSVEVYCTTNNSGWCPMSTPTRLGYDVYSDTFTMTSITVAGMTYTPTSNHDVDGSSNGNTITVSR